MFSGPGSGVPIGRRLAEVPEPDLAVAAGGHEGPAVGAGVDAGDGAVVGGERGAERSQVARREDSHAAVLAAGEQVAPVAREARERGVAGVDAQACEAPVGAHVEDVDRAGGQRDGDPRAVRG